MSISSTMATNSQTLSYIPDHFSQNIVFIDAQVEDYQSLINGVVAGTEVILLNPTQDGVEQITEHLVNRSNLDSVHIVSHGSPGCLYLGNSQLSLDTLEYYKSQLQMGFSNSAHLLLYGCNVAAGDAGAEFIEKLHQLTGAEIAASANPTGNAALSGDWQLEVRTNQFMSPLAFTEEAREAYPSVLAIFVVTNNDNSGLGSLRQAILDANTTPAIDTIEFDPGLIGQTIQLTSGELEIRDDLIINGLGKDELEISSSGFDTFQIPGSTSNIEVEITGLTVTNGEDGFGINGNNNTVKLIEFGATNQLGDDGIEINGNNNTVTLDKVTLDNNEDNLGIEGDGNQVQVFQSTIKAGREDGVEVDGSNNTLMIHDTTISNNGTIPSDPQDGIDVDGNGNILNLRQITVSSNSASGIEIEGSNNIATLDNSTVSFNNTGLTNGSAGISNKNSTSEITVRNTISAKNEGSDVLGNFISSGNNLIGDGTGSTGFTNGVNGDQVGTSGNPIDPLLGPLTNNGGPTETHAVLEDSPAINAGSNPLGLTTDQRGEARVQQGAPDIGAFESNLLPDAAFIVNSLDDNINPGDNLTTLREAIIEANNTPGLDTIEFDTGLTGGTINLSNGTLEITDDLSIDGLGLSNLSVSGNSKFDLFAINGNSEVSIQGLTITNGENGIAVDNDSSLELFDSTISFNREVGISGGNNSKIAVDLSQIDNNGSHGIELGENSNLEMVFSSIENNQGHGIQLDDDTVALVNHIVINNNGGAGISGGNGNEVGFSSGAIINNGDDGIQLDSDNQLTVFIDSAIENNTGNGIHLSDENTLTVIDSHINDNTHLGILASNDNNLEINNSTINNNDAGGIKLDESNTLMALETDILLNGGNGIEFDDENGVKVEQSRIENNSGVGLLGNNDNQIIVCRSTIDHNDDDGILIQDNNQITVEQNTSISNNLGDGISIGDNTSITIGTAFIEDNGGLQFRGFEIWDVGHDTCGSLF